MKVNSIASKQTKCSLLSLQPPLRKNQKGLNLVMVLLLLCHPSTRIYVATTNILENEIPTMSDLWRRWIGMPRTSCHPAIATQSPHLKTLLSQPLSQPPSLPRAAHAITIRITIAITITITITKLLYKC